MLRIQTMGLTIVAAVALSGVAAPSASAAHEWLINGKPIASAVRVHASSLMLYDDTKSVGGEIKVHCHRFMAAKVGPGASGLIENITAELLGTKNRIHCAFDKAGGCKSNSLLLYLPLNLPWLTLVTLINGHVRDVIEQDPNGGATGNPGWKTVCTNVLGGETVDECTAASPSTGLANVAAGVEAKFDAETPQANCSQGGSGAGLVTGFIFFESPSSGETLTFQ